MTFRIFPILALCLVPGTVSAHPPDSPASGKPTPAARISSVNRESAAVRAVLDAYKAAVERLDVSRTADLYTKDSMIFETGGVEGNYAQYLEHHLTPELAEFSEFKFNNYKVDVRVELPYAFATETYVYRIVVKADGKVVERQGVTSSVLRKSDGKWRILLSHNSSRGVKKD